MTPETSAQAVQIISPEEARRFLDSSREGGYTLLDVRQEWEFEEAHLPGATSIPLPELADRAGELDPDKPVLAYCRGGSRSLAGAGLLSGLGFPKVMSLKGGISAWNGQVAQGPKVAGLAYFKGDEGVEEVIRLAYRMEMSLEVFYSELASRQELREISSVLTKLAAFEAGHQQRLFAIQQTLSLSAKSLEDFERGMSPDLLEGAVDPAEFLEENRHMLSSPVDVLDMAMMLEAQALDVYLRYSRRSRREDAGRLLLELAEDEKSHLRELGTMHDQISPRP